MALDLAPPAGSPPDGAFGLGFIDSTGMEVLLDARSVALETGCSPTVLASPAVRRVAELLDLEDYLLGSAETPA
jgi:anti-anti-sigma regulatory factor